MGAGATPGCCGRAAGAAALDAASGQPAGTRQPASTTSPAPSPLHHHPAPLDLQLVITDTTSNNCSAQDHGGFLFCDSCSVIAVQGCSVTGNTAGGAGGAVAALHLTGISSIKQTSFLKNKANGKAR
jgi:hypothetical protein